MPKIVVTRMIPESGIRLLEQTCTVEVYPHETPPSREELFDLVKGADGILAMLSDRIDADLMDAAGPQLNAISNYAVGYDNIDLEAATARGIHVGNTPGVLTEATADLAFSLLISTARRVVESDNYVRAGKWKTWGTQTLLGYELNQKTLGVIGFGRIGKAMARRGKGFNMNVLFYSPSAPQDFYDEYNATKVDLETLLKQSDFVSLHCPLNERSMNLIDAKAFSLMKSNAILVNTARGKVIVTEDLITALKEGQIAGAGLDVTDPEPINMDNPLLALPNVVITPHIGSASYYARSEMSNMCAENLLAGIAGKPMPYPVN